MADPRPDLRKVKTKAGGDLLVDFNLLNPDQQEQALQYTPGIMSIAPAVQQSAPEKLYETAQDAPGIMSIAPRPEELQSTLPAPSPAPDVVSSTPYNADRGDPMWRGAPDPAPMVAPSSAQQDVQAPQTDQQPVQVVDDRIPEMGIVYTQPRRGGGGGGNRKILDAMDAEKQALQEGYAAQAAGAGTVSGIYDDALAKIEARNAEIEQKRVVGEKASNDAIKRHDQAIEEVRSMKVDPDHFMASRSTGQKIMMGFAIGLSHGDDRFLNAAIDRDIDAQNTAIRIKSEHVNNLKISAEMKKDMLHDLDQQAAIRTSQVLEAAKLKIESITARTSSQTAKAEGDKVIAQLTQRHEALKAQMAARAAAYASAKPQYWINTPGGPTVVGQKEYLAQMNKEQEHKWKMEEEGAKAKGEKQQLTVGGYTGFAPSKEAQTSVVQAHVAAAEIAKNADELIALRKKMLLPGLTPGSLSSTKALIKSKKANIFNKLRQYTGSGAALAPAEEEMILNMIGPIDSVDIGNVSAPVLEDLKKTFRFRTDELANGYGLQRNNAVSGGFKAE